MLRYRINYSGPAAGFSILHFDGALSEGGIVQANADALDLFLKGIDQFISNQQSMQVDSEVLEVDVGTGQTLGVGNIISTPTIGTQPGQMVPQLAQILVRWRTGFFSAGRELRGRTFIPGASAGAMATNGEVIASALADVEVAAESLHLDTEVGVWSPTKNVFATITSSSAWNEWASQRGRRQ